MKLKNRAPKTGDGELAKKLSDIYYEAINVYPPATEDFAGFRAIADFFQTQVEAAEKAAQKDG